MYSRTHALPTNPRPGPFYHLRPQKICRRNSGTNQKEKKLSISHTTWIVVWLIDALRAFRYGSSSGSVWGIAVWVKIFIFLLISQKQNRRSMSRPKEQTGAFTATKLNIVLTSLLWSDTFTWHAFSLFSHQNQLDDALSARYHKAIIYDVHKYNYLHLHLPLMH